MNKFIIICCLFACFAKVLAHDEGTTEADYKSRSFKEHLYIYSAGHGASHPRGAAIMKKLVLKFDKNLSTVIDVQSKANADRYLARITLFIKHSNLSDVQKHERYRASYERCLEEEKKGNEWGETLYVLIKNTEALTNDEIARHRGSGDKSVRLASEKVIHDRAVRDRRSQRKPASVQSEKLNHSNSGHVQPTKHEIEASSSLLAWLYGLSGVLIMAGIALVIRANGKKKEAAINHNSGSPSNS